MLRDDPPWPEGCGEIRTDVGTMFLLQIAPLAVRAQPAALPGAFPAQVRPSGNFTSYLTVAATPPSDENTSP